MFDDSIDWHNLQIVSALLFLSRSLSLCPLSVSRTLPRWRIIFHRKAKQLAWQRGGMRGTKGESGSISLAFRIRRPRNDIQQRLSPGFSLYGVTDSSWSDSTFRLWIVQEHKELPPALRIHNLSKSFIQFGFRNLIMLRVDLGNNFYKKQELCKRHWRNCPMWFKKFLLFLRTLDKLQSTKFLRYFQLQRCAWNINRHKSK